MTMAMPVDQEPELRPEDVQAAIINVDKEDGSSNGAGNLTTGEVKRGRGRPKLPRDEYGNIIRDGSGSSSSGSGSSKTSGKATAANRDSRKKQIVTGISELNPYLIQGLAPMMGVPIQYCMGVNLNSASVDFGSTFITPIGKMMILPDPLIEFYGTTGAHLQETPFYQLVDSKIGGVAPYGFVILAGAATIVWFVSLMKARPQLKEITEALQKAQQPGATETQMSQPISDDVFAPDISNPFEGN